MADTIDFIISTKSLESTSNEDLCLAWQEAFADYAVSATATQLLAMFSRRGYMPEVSMGVFVDNRMVSMTLNGIGCYNGMCTAYDTSTGTVMAYRRKGLAKRLFQEILPLLKERNVQQYILEVLTSNVNAKALYLSIGFTVIREFCFFRQPVRDVLEKLDTKAVDTPLNIQCIEISVLPDDSCVSAMWDFHPSWQNSNESMERSFDTIKIVGAYCDAQLVGYGIVEPSTGDIPQIAVAPAYRRQGTGTMLLKHLLPYATVEAVKVINVDITCTSLIGFLESAGMTNAGGQYEMQLLL